MGSVVAKHNAKVMKNSATTAPKSPANCNCQTSKKPECPMPGKCNQNGVVYQATVTSDGGKSEIYVGLAKNFKKRWSKHKFTIKDKNAEGGCTMSTYYHQEKDANRNPKVKFKYLEKNIQLFNSVTKNCRLCLREKYNIIFNPQLASLNERTEVFAHCRHMRLR